MLAAATVAALAAGAIAVTVSAGTAGAAPNGDEPAAPAPPVSWGKCADADLAPVPPEQRAKFSCAWYNVPVDHKHASQGSISLAMMRRAADTPNKVGSVFLNPGGPGGSGLRMPIKADKYFDPEVLTRFDIIGFDPRGVGASNPLRCFGTQEDADKFAAATSIIAQQPDEISALHKAFTSYGQSCKQFAGPLLEHMSTEDVARDLDQMRQGVGD